MTFGLSVGSMISIAMTVASAAYSQVQAQKQKKKAKEAAKKAEAEADAQKGFQIPIEGEILNIPVAYGRNKIGGLRTYHHAQNGYTYVAPETGVQVFTACGDTRDPNQLANSAVAMELNASGYYPTSGGSKTIADLVSVDPTPYVFDPSTNGMPQASADYVGQIYAAADSVIHALAANTRIQYAGTGTRYTVKTNNFPAPSLLVQGAAITIKHYAFMLTDNVASTVLGYFSYKVVSFDPFTDTLVLDGPDLAGTDSAGYGNGIAPSGRGEFPDEKTSFFDWDGDITNGFAPTMSFNRWGDRNEALFFRQVLCYENINDIVHITIDDKTYNTPILDTRIHCHKIGGSGDAMINGNIPDEVSSRYPGTAHIAAVAWLNRDEPQFTGVPALAFTIDGLLVSDILFDRATNTAQLGGKIYSNSPALCLLDYLMHPIYGKGLGLDEIDLVSFYWAHRCCDRLVQVNGTFYPPMEGEYWVMREKAGLKRTVHLYEANILIDTKESVRDNVEKLLNCMGAAEFIWADGRYRLSIPYPQEYKAVFDSTSLGPIDGGVITQGTPAFYNYGDVVQYPPGAAADVDLYMTTIDNNQMPPLDNGGNLNYGWIKGPHQRLSVAYITDDDIILSADISQAWTSLNDKLNYQTIKFFNEAKAFKEDSASWPPKNDPNNPVYGIYLNEDQGVLLEGESFQAGDTSYAHAMATAEEMVRSSRYNASLIFSASRRFIYIEPGDIIKIRSIILGIPGEMYRVSSVKATELGDISFEVTKCDCRNLAWNAKDDEVIEQRNVYSGDLAQATNLQFIPSTEIGVATGGTLTWNAALDTRVEKYSIRVSYTLLFAVIPGETDWWEIGVVAGTSFKIPAMVAKPMTATVVAISGDGKQSAPEYNVRTGSRWPLVSLVPLDAYLPLMATLTKSLIYVGDNAQGLPDLTAANGNFRLSKGATIYNDKAAYSVTSQIGATASVDDSTSTTTAGNYQITALGQPNASINFTAELDGQTFTRTANIIYTGNNFKTSAGGDITPPPTNVKLFAGITWYSVEHDPATYTVNGGHGATRIYAAERLYGAPAPVVSAAKLVEQSGGPYHVIGSEPATNWYVWASFVARNGIESVKVGPFITTTGVDVSKLITALEDEINMSTLADDVSTPINKIPGIETDVTQLEGQYTVKISTDGGYVAGYGLAVTGTTNPSSQFLVKADRFAVGAPGFDAWPFIVQASPTVINGMNVPAGVYMKEAMIANGTISNAKIGVAQVDTLRVAGNAITTAGMSVVGNIVTPHNGNDIWLSSANGFQNVHATVIYGCYDPNSGSSRNVFIRITLDDQPFSEFSFSSQGGWVTAMANAGVVANVSAGGHVFRAYVYTSDGSVVQGRLSLQVIGLLR